jgi:hypothetical protein
MTRTIAPIGGLPEGRVKVRVAPTELELRARTFKGKT